MLYRTFIILAIGYLVLYSCNGSKNKSAGESSEILAVESIEILLTPVRDSPEFPNAILEMNSPVDYDQLESGEISFNYNVKNYDNTLSEGSVWSDQIYLFDQVVFSLVSVYRSWMLLVFKIFEANLKLCPYSKRV